MWARVGVGYWIPFNAGLRNLLRAIVEYPNAVLPKTHSRMSAAAAVSVQSGEENDSAQSIDSIGDFCFYLAFGRRVRLGRKGAGPRIVA